MRFGKNRLQYEDFQWFFRKYDRYKIYYYEGGAELSLYASDIVGESLENLAQRFEYYYEDQERVNIMVYNKIEDFRQSNIGLNEEGDNNIGGVTQLLGRNVFVYFDGNHQSFQKNIRKGVARIFAQQMMFGDSWFEIIKNSTLLSVPDWYMEGLTNYISSDYVDMEPALVDAIMQHRFNKFSRLNKQESDLFGYALWYYISEVYGEKLIPNILYMSRVTRSIENGFMYVLGVSFNTLRSDMISYYENKYKSTRISFELPKDAQDILKTRRKYTYTNPILSPDGKKLAYIRHYLGKSVVFIYDFETKKRKKVFRFGSKIERIEDTSYPLIGWHPDGKILSVIYPKSFEVKLRYCSWDKIEKTEKTLFKVDKVSSFTYSPDGKKIVLSGISEGKSDIFLYHISSSTSERITNDIYDDLDPMFTDKNTLIFSSNRPNDTLIDNLKQEKEYYQNNLDLFSYNVDAPSKLLTRLTKTPFHERFPKSYDSKRFTYLADQNHVNSLFLAQRDSSISSVDTSIHYRYFIHSTLLSTYSTPISTYDVVDGAEKRLESVIYGGKTNIFTLPKEQQFFNSNPQKNGEKYRIDTTFHNPEFQEVMSKVFFVEELLPLTADTFMTDMNTDHYIFSSETNTSQPNTLHKHDSSVANIKSDTSSLHIRQKIIPSSRKYLINYTASDVTSQVDFDYANQLYQHFNGGPYVPPGMGAVIKVDMKDLFEDYKIEGGIRLGFNGTTTEYFASFEDRSKRWDKKYSYQRQTYTFSSDAYSAKTLTQMIKIRYTYPWSEVSSIRITPMLRRDRGTLLSTDNATLSVPDIFENWAGLKLEYVFDDSRTKGLNLYHGTKLKLFAEHYRVIEKLKTDIYILGTDIRHSIKVHRDIIWVNRFSSGFSFGERKLVHYLGAVDNWIYLSDKPRFDSNTPISQEAGYYFQTITPPLRGFIQNARNGNNFALINSELRIPIFKYLINKPIKSEFVQNFQIIGFGDIGTAWTGLHPYSDENAFNTKTYHDGNVTVIIKNQTDPIAAGIGWGLRTTLFGYFIRVDRAWGIENYAFKKPRYYVSLGLDF